MRTRKIVKIDPDYFVYIFKNGNHPKGYNMEVGLPENSKIIDVRMENFNSSTIELCVESDSFEEIEQSTMLPILNLVLRCN